MRERERDEGREGAGLRCFPTKIHFVSQEVCYDYYEGFLRNEEGASRERNKQVLNELTN